MNEEEMLNRLRNQIRKSFVLCRPEDLNNKEFEEYKRFAEKRLHNFWYWSLFNK